MGEHDEQHDEQARAEYEVTVTVSDGAIPTEDDIAAAIREHCADVLKVTDVQVSRA